MPSEYFNQISTLRDQTFVNKFPSYREGSRPTGSPRQRDTECTLCKGNKGGHENESCSGINTESNEFYVMVMAAGEGFNPYTGFQISFTGNNLLKVEQD